MGNFKKTFLADACFRVDQHFQLYLQRSEVSEETMDPDILREMRRAFYGAWGQLLLVCRDDLPNYSPIKGVIAMEDMCQQVEDFWDEEIRKQEGGES